MLEYKNLSIINSIHKVKREIYNITLMTKVEFRLKVFDYGGIEKKCRIAYFLIENNVKV